MANVTVGGTFKHNRYGRVTVLAYTPTDRGGLVLIGFTPLDNPFNYLYL